MMGVKGMKLMPWTNSKFSPNQVWHVASSAPTTPTILLAAKIGS